MFLSPARRDKCTRLCDSCCIIEMFTGNVCKDIVHFFVLYKCFVYAIVFFPSVLHVVHLFAYIQCSMITIHYNCTHT